MRAIVQHRYGPPDVLNLADIDKPVAGEGEVLVRVRAAGLGPEVWHLTTGLPYLVRAATGPRRPRQPVPGRDLAGTVEAVGAGVKRFKPGDKVFGIGEGTFAEYALAPADKLVRKPVNITFEQAAATPVSGLTALRAVRDTARIEAGHSILVIGAGGGVGTWTIQYAKAAGAHVTGVCSTGKTELVASLGADRVIDYTRDEPTDRPQRYDVIIDTAGYRSLKRLRTILEPRGTLVIIGAETAGAWLGGLQRQLLAAATSPFTTQHLASHLPAEKRADLQTLADNLRDGLVAPVIGQTRPLAEVPEALRDLNDGHARGKTVITVP